MRAHRALKDNLSRNMVTRQRQSARFATVPALFERLANLCAADTFLRCAVWNYFNERATGILRFVTREVKELRPSGITYGLRQLRSGESFNVQIFDGYQAVVINNPARDFVMKVGTLIANVNVNALEQKHGLTPSVRASLTSGKFALRPSKLRLRLSKPTWVLK